MSSERQLSNSSDRWWGEHVHRYNEVLPLIGNSDVVLDIACGTGFGTAILAQHTSGNVIGGDIDLQTIQECRKTWNKANLSFKVLDGTALDFSDNFFDIIVSFETIEHTDKYKKMISEFFRVLKPGQYLIISTPNAHITSPNGIIKNKFHTQEFRYKELKDLLGEYFESPVIYGQRYSRYDKKSIKNNAALFFEKAFLSFGIRKLPYSFRNAIMKSLFGYNLYPVETDFVLEKGIARINSECPVLFAICKK